MLLLALVLYLGESPWNRESVSYAVPQRQVSKILYWVEDDHFKSNKYPDNNITPYNPMTYTRQSGDYLIVANYQSPHQIEIYNPKGIVQKVPIHFDGVLGSVEYFEGSVFYTGLRLHDRKVVLRRLSQKGEIEHELIRESIDLTPIVDSNIQVINIYQGKLYHWSPSERSLRSYDLNFEQKQVIKLEIPESLKKIANVEEVLASQDPEIQKTKCKEFIGRNVFSISYNLFATDNHIHIIYNNTKLDTCGDFKQKGASAMSYTVDSEILTYELGNGELHRSQTVDRFALGLYGDKTTLLRRSKDHPSKPWKYDLEFFGR